MCKRKFIAVDSDEPSYRENWNESRRRNKLDEVNGRKDAKIEEKSEKIVK